MHRIYICTRFTCFTNTAKLALFTGLEHSANTNTLAIAPGRIKEGWVQTPHKFLNSGIFFCHVFLNIGTTLRAKTYSWRQPPKWEKWCYIGRIEYFRKAGVTMFCGQGHYQLYTWIPQTEILHMCSEDPLSTDCEYNMQLPETSSVHWVEIIEQ